MRLTKHHGLGNDFLVLIDLAGVHDVTPALAVALCDRRRGVGADGLLHATAGGDGADVTMRLLNADGSEAEMSGNGIRCLVQAVLDTGVVTPPEVRVATGAGLRTVTVVHGLGERTQRASVDMGQAKVLGDEPVVGEGARRAVRVDVGNPHVVLEWAEPRLPHEAVLVALGSRLDGEAPAGTNVELVVPGPGPGQITMAVYERGVGPTLACGTGACAAAAAAHHWGMAGPEAVVHMPGGSVGVALGDPVVLTGEATSIATVEVTWP